MSDILGHDIDGRPLRVGDQVVAAWVAKGKEKYGSKVFIVVGTSDHPMFPGQVRLSVLRGHKEAGLYGEPSGLRKLHNDHRPADQSFAQIMNGLRNRTPEVPQ